MPLPHPLPRRRRPNHASLRAVIDAVPGIRAAVANRQSGFTLIEVLVAILVLSFGMLGVVGLQVAAMQANKEARYQSSGVRYARELAESMRANKTVLALATSDYMPVDTFSAVPAGYSCVANSASAPACATAAELSKQDMSDWWVRASNELPGLRAVVCQDAAPYDGSGRPVWACTAPAATSAGQNIYVKLGWTQQSTNRAATGQSGSAILVRAGPTGGGIPLVVIPIAN